MTTEVRHLRLGARYPNDTQRFADENWAVLWHYLRLANSFKGVSGMIRSWNLNRLQWWAGVVGLLAILASSAFVARVASAQDDKPWVAPDAAKQVKNPVPVNPESLAAGAQLYHENCAPCHGDTGKGDGDTGKIIKKKPANFTDEKMMSAETDGSIFWKMGEGRGPMPSWKDELSDKERWQLVIYIRKLGKDAAAANPPGSKDK
jgi:mono/diheme cytochrome c family protein